MLNKKIKTFISNPIGTLKIFFRNPLLFFTFLFRNNYNWNNSEGDKFKKREYKNYTEYVLHQKSKLKIVKDSYLPKYDKEYREELRGRLCGYDFLKKGTSVLCLAARIGTEVKAFLDLGCFAIGIDLEPGKDNKYVVCGDFHNIQFSDESVDVVFNNSLDHSFDLEKLIKEINRVLKISGYCIVEIPNGESEGTEPGSYESVTWEKIDDVINVFLKNGFDVFKTVDISIGKHVILQKIQS
jgi:SAM-dependent methyltransferase